MTFAPLYVCRPVRNGDEIVAWFRANGVQAPLLEPAGMHVTLAYSQQPLHWGAVPPDTTHHTVQPGPRSVKRFDKGATVLCFDDAALHGRWRQFRNAGASWSYDGFRPHVTLTYQGDGLATDSLLPYPGPIELGPERFSELDTEWSPMHKSAPTDEALDRAVVVTLPTIVKARSDGNGRRIVEVEASCEAVDSEGDVILQSALLDSAQSFVATGVLDIDHLSELGSRLGIPDPASYIVGRPLEVKSLSGKRTSVVGEIRRAMDGVHNPQRHRYDDLWDSLQSDPPVPWYASVYGFPKEGAIEDCTKSACAHGARRYLIKAMDWRSLAFTRNPVNTALRGQAKIVSAKSMIAQMAKAMSIIDSQSEPFVPSSMSDLWAMRACQKCGVHGAPSLPGYRAHFVACAGYPQGLADICAHAVMHKTNMERVFGETVAPIPTEL